MNTIEGCEIIDFESVVKRIEGRENRQLREKLFECWRIMYVLGSCGTSLVMGGQTLSLINRNAVFSVY